MLGFDFSSLWNESRWKRKNYRRYTVIAGVQGYKMVAMAWHNSRRF